MHQFYATLIRERFTLTPQKSKDDVQAAISNRLDFRCFDKTGAKEASFIVRAQNIHTTLRIAAQLAKQWYEYGHINASGRDRFNWKNVYKDATDDFEKKWNYKCWASVYKNGTLKFTSDSFHKSEVLDIIEQVQVYSKGDYKDITAAAGKIFAKAGRPCTIDYDGNIALDLHGSRYSVQTNIIYRDNDGRNTINLHIKQKELKYVQGALGAYIKLSEALSLAAVIFEGYQLGFVIGRTQHQLATGEIGLGNREAVHADHGIRRLERLGKALNDMKEKYQLIFDPKPDFIEHVKQVEDSFKD